MTITQIVWLTIAVTLGILCVFGLGFCGGSIFELGRSLNEIRRELFDNNRDLKALEKMQKEHDAHIELLKKLEKNYNETLLWYSQESERNDNVKELFMRQQQEKPKDAR
jgi:biopolymer transport protein ExbB/TolQ